MSRANLHSPVGVIGAGSFGTTLAKLLAENTKVLIYSRNEAITEKINSKHEHQGVSLPKSIIATNDLSHLAKSCTLIFPVVPSLNFREMMRTLAPNLRPYHILIHGTKGLDVKGVHQVSEIFEKPLNRADIATMSEVIRQESVVVRVGCLSGPNLSAEILEGQPTGTVIGSRFDEVIEAGIEVLQSKQFYVFGTHEILGAELAGALKNAIAIGSGILHGLGLGKNIQGMLITRGLNEMVLLGIAMGASNKAFLGTAGIGDLITTATSAKSRNFTFGMRIGKGESLEEILNTMPELAEGVRTIQIMRHLGKYYQILLPICDMLFRIVFEQFDPKRAIHFLMQYPYGEDVDFL